MDLLRLVIAEQAKPLAVHQPWPLDRWHSKP
jgi:hypothetical protein